MCCSNQTPTQCALTETFLNGLRRKYLSEVYPPPYSTHPWHESPISIRPML